MLDGVVHIGGGLEVTDTGQAISRQSDLDRLAVSTLGTQLHIGHDGLAANDILLQIQLKGDRLAGS